MEMISITLNGARRAFPAPLSLAGLLETLGLAGKPVAIELDERAVFPRDYAATPVEAEAKVEIVTLAAGG